VSGIRVRRCFRSAALLLSAVLVFPVFVSRSNQNDQGAEPQNEPSQDRGMGGPAQTGVQMTRDTSGWDIVEEVFKRMEKPPDWNQDMQSICQVRRRAEDIAFDIIQSMVQDLDRKEWDPRNRWKRMRAHWALALWSDYQGKMDQALEHFQTAYQLAVAYGAREDQLALLEEIGTAYYAQADQQNHVKVSNGKACIFPIDPAARYEVTSGSEHAIKYFLKYLELKPEDLEVRWLLNLAFMTLGEYPAGVPQQYLIPSSAFQSKEDIGRFVDVAPTLGLNILNEAGGIIVDDFDNDGFLDIVTSSFDPCAPMHYFHNNGDGTFTDRSVESGIAKQLGGANLLQADYNNDGCMDILVLRGAFELPMRKSLLRNNCDGTFTDVTREAGLAVPATPSEAAAWADFDNDGNVDLFVGNEDFPSQLFRNKGDGTFADVASAAGVDRKRFAKGVVAGDYDNDGYPDFYVSNEGSTNFLYHNNRNGTFTDVASQLHVELPIYSYPVWFFDYDNDGWPDLFVASYVDSDAEILRSYLNLPVKAEGSKLYKNIGGHSFRDVTKDVELDRVFSPMGVNFGDVDNDGFLDFYLGTGAPPYGSITPHVLMRNDKGKRFVDITTSSGTGELHKGHGVAFADLNNSGNEDILEIVGGAVPGDRHAMVVFRNPGHSNNWITVHLVGVKTNRAAIGARIKLTLTDGGDRSIYRTVSSGGSFGASPLQQHIGLGKAKRIDTLEIWWPNSDTRQVFHDVGVNQFIEIKEFEKNFVKLNRRSFPLGEKTGTRLVTGGGR